MRTRTSSRYSGEILHWVEQYVDIFIDECLEADVDACKSMIYNLRLRGGKS